MAYKTLEITLISAKGLKNVNLIGKMDVYVVVHLSDDPKNKQKTHVHKDGGTNPSWNYTMRFNIDDTNASRPGKYIVFTLKHEHTFGSDKELGEVLVPLKELLDGVKDLNSPHFVTYQVRRVSSGKPQGELKLSYKLIDISHSSSSLGSSSIPCPPRGYGNVYPQTYQQNTAGYLAPNLHGVPVATGVPYPAPQSHEKPAPAAVPYPSSEGYPHGTGVPYAAPYEYPSYGGYPPQHAGGGYGYPPFGGYPPPRGYHSYPPQGYMQQPQKPKKNNFGVGLGAGLLGGALGGLVLGEMVDDAFDADVDF